MENNFAIDLNKIYLKRGETEVFTELTWRVKQGEHWFVMGDNGCGKTSLLEIIMGYLWPQKGTVRVLGEQLGQTFIPELRKRIGYVSPWIFKRMGHKVPVEKVVASGTDGSVGYWGDIPENLIKKVEEKLDFFHCASLAKRPFGMLSSGQQFKVILARALINDPELFLLDEPFSQLDIGARMQAYDLIEKWADLGHSPSIILVTHHIDDISSSYKNGLLLKDRKTYLTGVKEEILTNKVFKDIFDLKRDIF
ncbi:MAG: ATP-binding cassette domain-containing protein [Candidatus Omnitrophica bacterium]|nr:ATP-binding cassette domain-containing protein [Candidatus Omnitrophota bacterium]